MREMTTTRRSERARWLLAGGACGIVAALLAGGRLPPASEAIAQTQRAAVANPLDQRREMIEELRAIRSELARLTDRIEKQGVSVKVTSMPAVRGE